MKTLRNLLLAGISAALGVAVCKAADPTSAGGLSMGSTAASSGKDIAACEQHTKDFLSSDYVGNKAVAARFFTKPFARLWIWASNPPEGEVIWWGCDPILETQDSEPKLVSFGPGVADGAKVLVPVVYQHRGNPPFTKTFVFVKEGDEWRVSDILTTGLPSGSGSEAAKIGKDYGKSWPK